MRQRASDISRRASQVAARGVLESTDPSKKMQEVSVRILKGERKRKVEHWEGYGVTARPKKGAEALVVFPAGKRSHAIVVAIGDRRYRLKGLKDGAVALYDYNGQQVRLDDDGITIETDKPVTVESEAPVTVKSGEKVVVESELVYLGGEEDARAVVTVAGPSTKVFAQI